MVGAYRIRTDLALESQEKIKKDHMKIPGVSVHEEYDREREIRTTWVCIENEHGARMLEKPVGSYLTIEAPRLAVPDEGSHREVSEVLAQHLKKLLPRGKEKSFLVIGLGNEEITPDALGPLVVRNLRITRHVIREYGQLGIGTDYQAVSALIPGVMAQTGMETLEIIKGVLDETKPDAVIVIDALAARSTRRLNCTIQISDAGIAPGSGVGNHRRGINEQTLGVPVIAIGVPTVVDAATIVYDAMEELLESLEEAEIGEFMAELITPALRSMFVTPKDVDETVKRLSFTISEALNMSFSNV